MELVVFNQNSGEFLRGMVLSVVPNGEAVRSSGDQVILRVPNLPVGAGHKFLLADDGFARVWAFDMDSLPDRVKEQLAASGVADLIPHTLLFRTIKRLRDGVMYQERA